MVPLPLITPPLQHSKFTLDIFSVAGFFGGDEVVEATATLHLYKGRRWRGWYNSPGAYTVAKYFGRIADSRFWRGLFQGALQDPETAFGLDGKKGPKYLGVLSGTEIVTGHIGHLLASHLKGEKGMDLRDANHRTTRTVGVTIVDLKDVKRLDKLSIPSSKLHLLSSYFTMFSSVACTICSLILFGDKICFAIILLGTLIGGVSSIIIGMGKLSLDTVFKPAPGSPPGDGVLIGEEIVVLRGSESHVNAITKGKFRLDLVGRPKYHIIGVCSALYFFQFIAQLFLIPQGTLPGQIMFLLSFGIAWIYNCILASIDKEKIQTKLLLESIEMDQTKYSLPNRTMATTFACLSLRRSAKEIKLHPAYNDFNPECVLAQMIPNDTAVWRSWREILLDVLQSRQPPEYLVTAVSEPKFSQLRSDQRDLLSALLRDAKDAYDKYDEVVLKGGTIFFLLPIFFF
jgi:hypothetical protein